MVMFLFRQLFYQRRSLILTVLANTVAIFLLLCVNTFSNFLIKQFQQQLDKLAVSVENIQLIDDGISQDSIDLLFEENEINELCRYYYSDYQQFRLVSCDSSLASLFDIAFVKGNFFKQYQVEYNDNVVVLGYKMYQDLGYPIIGEYISINGALFKVVGVIEEGCSNLFFDCDDSAFFPFDYRFGSQNRSYFFQSEKKIDEEVVNKYIDEDSYLLLSQKESEQAFDTILKVTKDVLIALSFVSLIVSFIGIINNSLANIQNRRQEIGIKKAVGATNKDIYRQFLLETLTVMIMSILWAFTALAIVILLLRVSFDLKIEISLKDNLSVIFIVTLLGVISGIYPAVQASKVTILSALRH